MAQRFLFALPGGRRIGIYADKQGRNVHTQDGLFEAVKELPLTERVMSVGDMHDACRAHIEGALEVRTRLSTQEWGSSTTEDVRTGDYAVYSLIPGQALFARLGSRVTVTDFYLGSTDYFFEVPDVRNPENGNVGLRASAGIAIFDVHKLDYAPETKTVSASTGFNPETDVRIITPEQFCSSGFPDRYGYPDKNHPTSVLDARGIVLDIRLPGFLSGKKDGWHGSIQFNSTANKVLSCGLWGIPQGIAVAQSVPK